MPLLTTYRRGLGAFTDRVAQVRPDQWSAPTPCADWDVRALVNHIVYENRWTVPLLHGATMADVGDRFEGDLLGDDPVAAAREAAAEADRAAREPGVLDRTVALSFGDTPAEEYLRQLLADHVVHGWDLAAAIGAQRHLDDEAAAEVAAWFAEREDTYRQVGAIAERVRVGPDAQVHDRLIAAFGRNPRWSPRA